MQWNRKKKCWYPGWIANTSKKTKQNLGDTAPKSQDRLKRLLSDGSTGELVVSKAISLNLNFSFLNRISLLVILNSCPLSLRGWVDRVSVPILSEKFLWYSRKSKPGPFGLQSDLLITIQYQRSGQYEQILPALIYLAIQCLNFIS